MEPAQQLANRGQANAGFWPLPGRLWESRAHTLVTAAAGDCSQRSREAGPWRAGLWAPALWELWARLLGRHQFPSPQTRYSKRGRGKRRSPLASSCQVGREWRKPSRVLCFLSKVTADLVRTLSLPTSRRRTQGCPRSGTCGVDCCLRINHSFVRIKWDWGIASEPSSQSVLPAMGRPCLCGRAPVPTSAPLTGPGICAPGWPSAVQCLTHFLLQGPCFCHQQDLSRD